ncbi:putative metalloprotease CJM1_0395 family protein [Chitinimonas koreensis]|uniref:putative metalloprotease CJM1_0395 family protein n=1 Tax=Chitinimonas koreensis TaxID=356302 RepID=UPI0004093316|nr:putative metalloprotease CJM1_0395 family protein [Chitinimonas koreensis]
MSISGVSYSSAYSAMAGSARLHSPGCSCPMCMPVRVESTPAQVDSQPPAPDLQQGGGGTVKAGKQLSEEQQDQLRKLQARDREVRQHEQAHLAAAGGLAVSGPTYTFQRGPDGVSYAIGGEVNIDTSPGRTPQETLTRAQTIERAALAPKDPSGADRAVAAQARQMAQEAHRAIAQQRSEATGAGGEAVGQAGEAGKRAGSAAGADPGGEQAGNPRQDKARRAYADNSQAETALSLISAYA